MKKAKCYTQLKDLKQANDYYMMAIEIQPNKASLKSAFILINALKMGHIT